MRHPLPLVLSLFSVLLFAFAAGPAGAGGPDWSAYELNQYITSSGAAPSAALSLDGNGDLLLDCAGGATRESLRERGVSFTESRLFLLRLLRVLREEGDTLRPAFPILGPEETARLHALSLAAAPGLAEEIAGDLRLFLEELEKSGRSGSAYTVLFCYVLDDLVWDRFEEAGLIRPRAITAEEPFWNGTVWAITPPRAFSMGTNKISDGGVSLMVNWTEAAIPKMIPFVADWKNLSRLFEDFAREGRVVDPEARRVFAPFRFFDGEGRITAPVIDASTSNGLWRASDRLARRVARAAPSRVDLDRIAAEFRFLDAGEALVIIYHELMWDLMDLLEEEGKVRKPPVFADPEGAAPEDVGDLVFFVRAAV